MRKKGAVDDQHVVRTVRADARRNLDALLRAAMATFNKSGVDAPMRVGSPGTELEFAL